MCPQTQGSQLSTLSSAQALKEPTSSSLQNGGPGIKSLLSIEQKPSIWVSPPLPSPCLLAERQACSMD